MWTADQIAHFQSIGNVKAAALYEARLPPNFRRPVAASSLAMEKFIRDKYERRMYASPEAAGVAPPAVFPSASSARAESYVASNPRNQSLGPRPSIYAMLPPKKNSYDSRGSNLNAHSYSNQFLATGQSSNNFPPSQPLEHLSPVATSLIEMGFPPELSTQAADRFGNDLQKAADWVLRQKSVRLYNAPAPRRPPPRTVPVPDSLMDITGANEVKAAVPQRSVAVPKAFGTDSLLGPPIPVQQSTSDKQSMRADDDDFTDFSSFKTALPEKAAASPPNKGSSGNTSLNATLAGLYAKGPAKSPVGVSRMPRSPPLNNRIGPFSSLGNQLGTQSRTGNYVNAKQQPEVGVSTIPTPEKPAAPPPPPPVDIEFFSGGDEQPPPPSPLKEEETATSAKEEDPFAFLAKEALSSASSKKKDLNIGKTKESVRSSAKPDVPFNKDSNASAQAAGSDFSFDDLLK